MSAIFERPLTARRINFERKPYAVIDPFGPFGDEIVCGNLGAEYARLFADAPNLLKALKLALAFIDSHVADPDITAEMRENHRALEKFHPHALIAQIEGRSL